MLLPATGLDAGCQGAPAGTLPSAAPSARSGSSAPPAPAPATTSTTGSRPAVRIP
jgi:hypothetical protein